MAKFHHSGARPLKGLLRGVLDVSPAGASEGAGAPAFLAVFLALFAFFFTLAREEALRHSGLEGALAREAAPIVAVLAAPPKAAHAQTLSALFSRALGASGIEILPGEALRPGVAAAAHVPTADLFIGRTSAIDPAAADRLRTLRGALPELADLLGSGGRFVVRVAPKFQGEEELAARRAEALAALLGSELKLALRFGVNGRPGSLTALLLEEGSAP